MAGSARGRKTPANPGLSQTHVRGRVTQVRIIAEIGINHNGSEDTARALIDAAADAGAWGIKFQYRNLANAYSGQDRDYR